MATFKFADDNTGTIIMGQKERPIQRMNYGYGQGASQMLGVWSVSIVAPIISGMGLSDVLGYTSIEDGMAIGRRVFNSTHPSVVVPVQDSKLYASTTIINDREMMVSVYQFAGLNKLAGLTTIVPHTATGKEAADKIINSGFLLTGNRNANSSDISTKSAHAAQIDDSQVRAISGEINLALDDETLAKIEAKLNR